MSEEAALKEINKLLEEVYSLLETCKEIAIENGVEFEVSPVKGIGIGSTFIGNTFLDKIESVEYGWDIDNELPGWAQWLPSSARC